MRNLLRSIRGAWPVSRMITTQRPQGVMVSVASLYTPAWLGTDVPQQSYSCPTRPDKATLIHNLIAAILSHETMKFRKKPVVIDAIKWIGSNFIEIDEFITVPHETFPSQGKVLIPTLEGTMEASNGDYIIRGVSGEFYPCKPDIFQETYEVAELSPFLRLSQKTPNI